MINVNLEKLREGFEKYHLKGLPFDAVIHKISEPDVIGPHDHPFSFHSFILSGGYVERVYHLDDVHGWSSTLVYREPGDSFEIKAIHIHEIVRLLDKECYTLILPRPWERHWGFWNFNKAVPEFIKA